MIASHLVDVLCPLSIVGSLVKLDNLTGFFPFVFVSETLVFNRVEWCCVIHVADIT